ncbi:hypothetical protein [Azospirillum thermophilum]|uniref:Uncharacterized protein n=1 Tax=Azospirillum thermophilum TaxID=2202148 RepID=A0A2S2CNQ9_9PROT|nr:hypothetical protein [Azospirillum thermophilum]AWK86010.1 hypothetical protein DEW08_06855 [Azospirillum thermophilum]
MRMPDPWNWIRWIDPEDRRPISPDAEHLVRWGVTVALCLFLASLYPPEAVPVMLGGFLLLAALAAAVAAGLRGEPLFAPHFTRWDEAAASAALGLLAWNGMELLRGLFPAVAGGP